VVGKAIVFDINCDEAEELLLKYKVVGVPTIVVLNKNMSIHSSNKLNMLEIVGYLPEKTKSLFK
jgi:thioredoxin-related protein